MIATQQEIGVLAVFGINQRRAGQRVLHPAKLRDRVQRDDEIGENRGEDPEHHQQKADHAHRAVEQFAVKPQLALVADRHGEGDDQRDPDRQKLLQNAGNDLAP